MYRFVALLAMALAVNGQWDPMTPSKTALPSAPLQGSSVFGSPLSGSALPASPVMSAQMPVSSGFSAQLPSAPVGVKSSSYSSAPVYSTKTVAAPQQNYGPVEAAVHTRRTVEYRQVAVPQQVAQPQVIEVGPNYESVLIHFKTASSPLNVRQSHSPAPVGPVEHTSTQDNAHRLVHEVLKPVIQEVREVIQPYRRITQEIRPVIEEIHTVVHKGERVAYQQPLPMQMAAPAYGPGAAMAAAKGYKAAKAA